MNNSWINPKIIIGNSATGEYYYNRPIIVNEIWEEVAKPNHVLIAAPRRIGKSSVMEHMAANPPENIKCIFKNIQGAKSEKEFYKIFYGLIVNALNSATKKWQWITGLWKELKIEEVGLDGVKIGKNEPDFLAEINLLIHKLKDKDIRLVLFIDELPEVLYRLHKENKTPEAVSILKNLRSWLLSPEFKKSISLVLAGSVGIGHVVQLVEGRTADINHLGRVEFEPMDRKTAAAYVSWATKEATLQYTPALKNYLLDKINYYVPYFINLLINEINKAARKENKATVTKAAIDGAFAKVVANSDYFIDWKNRLFDYLSKTDALFLNEVLAYAAWHNTVSVRKVYDIRSSYGSTHNCMELVDSLLKDGYMVRAVDEFTFISPFLQEFWKRNNPQLL
jgi:uncharacterized protein